jgi:phage shock protein C
MSASRTTFYLDPYNGKLKGVCAGIADYTGIEVMWIRIAAILLMVGGIGFPWIPLAYWLIALMAHKKPIGLYPSEADAKFWQGVRSNPKRSASEVRSKFRDVDRRLADIETFYTSRNTALASEIDSLR